MAKPDPEPTNPLIQRAREALATRSGGDAQAADDAAEPGTDAAPPVTDLRRSAAEAGQRIQSIVDAAERVAEEIRAEAEAEASRYLSEKQRDADGLVEERAAQLSGLGDSLVGRVERVRELADQLIAELEGAVAGAHRVGAARTQPVTTPGGERPASPPIPRPTAYPGTGARGEEPGSPTQEADADAQTLPEEALLRATQLAVSGSGREEIEKQLASEFGLDDPATVVDEILGESDSD